ncbi:MAG: peptidase M4 family protein [Legionella sp.]|nr:MAG: peptidase M4 family protein [Legionella sp.]
MLKKTLFIMSILASSSTFATEILDLHAAPLSSLNDFSIKQNNDSSTTSTLVELNKTQTNNKTIVRYQQRYQGIPVVGAQVVVSKKSSALKQSKSEVSGHLLNELEIDISPAFNANQALNLAKQAFIAQNQVTSITDEASELQIRPTENDQLTLVYLISFKTLKNNKPMWPFFIVDAQTGKITNQWDNIKNYIDSGPGGNEKLGEYWYGKDGLPGLNVTKHGAVCAMENQDIQLINLNSTWDYNHQIVGIFQYTCEQSTEENINGAYSPTNDAYFFGQTVVDMYKNWYGVNVLQNPDGTPMKLVLRVHFGKQHENAFWDGEVISFGDGKDLFPLVSLDITGHEVSHGFTEQHSGLEYHDQSGAINEAFSDMAGQASRAYLLEQNPAMYQKAYLNTTLTWGIGETIMRDVMGKALRFMDFPSSDGSSADCLDKALAQSSGAYCAQSYAEVVTIANDRFYDPNQVQSLVVHASSGIYNKAFYLLSKELGVKSAFHLMLTANTKYWTPTTNFKEGACGVLQAAKDLNMDEQKIRSAFNQVGVDTVACVF